MFSDNLTIYYILVWFIQKILHHPGCLCCMCIFEHLSTTGPHQAKLHMQHQWITPITNQCRVNMIYISCCCEWVTLVVIMCSQLTERLRPIRRPEQMMLISCPTAHRQFGEDVWLRGVWTGLQTTVSVCNRSHHIMCFSFHTRQMSTSRCGKDPRR